MKMMSLLLFLPTFLTVTTGTVHIVTPDDYHYPNTTCHHCHNLQYYLLNVTKYFTSNAQLLFLPGKYHINPTIMIQNVHNISLIGNDTVLVIDNSVVSFFYSIAIINSSEVTTENFVIKSYFIYLENSFSILLHNMTMEMIIEGYNVMGANITNYGIKIFYNDNNILVKSNSIHKLRIYNMIQKGYCDIQMMQLHYEVSIIITDSVFSKLFSITAEKAITKVTITSSYATHYVSTIIFDRIHFLNNDNRFL